MTRRRHAFGTPLLFGLAAFMSSGLARADLASDLAALEVQSAAALGTLQSAQGPLEGLCGGLVAVNQAARDLASAATAVDEGLASPLTVDASVLEALERLSAVSLELAVEASRLTTDLDAQQSAAEALDLRDALGAVLQLSADIGVMADRIGAMSDKILVMADDIGVMADRILRTQQIQGENLRRTEQTLVATQANALAMVSVVEDATYGLSFAGLAADAAALAADLQSLRLRPWTMASRLAGASSDVRALAHEVAGLQEDLQSGTRGGPLLTSATALGQLMDLSAALAGFGVALDGYVVAISGLQAITSTPTLLDALRSVLLLSADIGAMADRINEMADQVLAMSDNIGMQADQLVLTQQTVSGMLASTQLSVLAAQQMAVVLFAARAP